MDMTKPSIILANYLFRRYSLSFHIFAQYSFANDVFPKTVALLKSSVFSKTEIAKTQLTIGPSQPGPVFPKCLKNLFILD